MAEFESLRPRINPGFASPDEGSEQPVILPLNQDGSTAQEALQREPIPDTVDTPVVSNMGSTEPPVIPAADLDAGLSPSPTNQIKPSALENQGINWEDNSHVGSDNPTLAAARTGFYNVDYDPEGKVNKVIGEGRDHVLAANVFGKQFSRDELMKDEEGRRLVHLMEVQRRGSHREEGFWTGLLSFKDTSGSYKRALGDIPFLGWMVDAGLTVGETIDASKAMRKMQNGEKVSNHEALMVRRFMLQSEMDSERGIGYKAGELFHSSIPFMFEIAAAGYLVAKATSIGAAVGGVPGAVIGAVGGLIFGGVGAAWRAIANRGASAASRQIAKGATKATLSRVASAEFGKDAVSFADRMAIGRFVKRATPDSVRLAFDEAKEVGRRRALMNLGKATAIERFGEKQAAGISDDAILRLGKSAVDKMGEKAFAERSSFEATKALAERYANIVDPGMTARQARRFLVGGDQERIFHYGLTDALEQAALRKAPAMLDNTASYGLKKSTIRGLFRDGKGLTDEEAKKVVTGFIEGTLKAGEHVEGETLGQAARAVVQSMERSLGGSTVSQGYAREVLDYLGKTTLDSFNLKYGAKTTSKLFASNMERFGRFVADGILDGALRWDSSMFGGLGTIARDGSAISGKMNVLKEAMKVSLVEAPVRGALQISTQIPLWPVAAAASGNSPSDFVVKGQLGIQAQALRTGDKELMDDARAIAIGSGVVEYISENAGRGFNMFMGGILKPTASKLMPDAMRNLGSALSRKVELVFGTEEKMRRDNVNALVAKIASRLGSEVAAGRVSGTVSKAEIEALVKTGKASASLDSVLSALNLSPRKVVRQAFTEVVTDGKVRTAALGLVAFKMMQMGWTPQKMARVLQRVGYDGMLSEMAEERYGGFIQGVLGLNERPSDEGFRGRFAAAMEGLFPDKEQLAVEAIGFAIPSVGHMSLNAVMSRLGQGQLAQLRQDSQTLNIVKSTRPEISIGGVSAEYVAARRKHQDEIDARVATRFGTVEDNLVVATADPAKVRSNIMERLQARDEEAKQQGQPLPPTDDLSELEKLVQEGATEDEVSAEVNKLVNNIIESSDNSADLEYNLTSYDIENVLGTEAAEAIRNIKRLDPTFTDQVKSDFFATKEMTDLVAATPKANDYAKPMSVNDVINNVEMTVPVRGENQSAIADTVDTFSTDSGIRANQYGNDLLGEVCKSMSNIAKSAYRLKTNGTTLPENATMRERFKAGGYKVLSRLAAVTDAILTGDLSLAARNPVQWALADESIDKSLMSTLLSMYERSVRIGMAQVASEDRAVLSELEDAVKEEAKPILDEIDAARSKMATYKEIDPIAYEGARAQFDDARERLDAVLKGYTQAFDIARLEDMNQATVRLFEAAGEPAFQSMLRMYASRYLAARNVLAIAQSDLEPAALSVVANDYMVKRGTATTYRYTPVGSSKTMETSDFTSREFREAHREEIDAAKGRIIDSLVNLATGDAIRVNTNARFSVTDSTAAAVDYRRAIRSGTTPEILAAIEQLPAFSSYRAVLDVSYGAGTQDTLSALGSSTSLPEFLAMTEDENGELSPGDLMKIMRFRGRDFVYATPEQNQRDAKRFLRQIRLLANNTTPYEHTDADGNSVDVTYSSTVNKDTGARVITATVWREENGNVFASATYAANDMAGVISALKTAGIDAKMRNVVLAKSFSIASRDATSLLLFRFGSRENARRYFLSKGVTEEGLPPQLRKVVDTVSGRPEWEFPDDADAAEQMKLEIMEASNATPTVDEDTAALYRARVYGGEVENKKFAGYEAVASEYLRSVGISRVLDVREENLVLGSGEMWVLRPNSLSIGDSLILSGDYNSSGDSETILRAVLESALLNKSAQEFYAGRTGFNDTMRGICEAFDSAVAELSTELQSLKPEWASRITKLKQILDGPDIPKGQTVVNARKVAAIAASTLCFTSDRGLNDRGNGFLLSPELATVADIVRSSEFFTTFVSAVDEALGGVGLFSTSGNVGVKVLELIDNFAPTGAAVANARRSAIFNRTGEEGAAKPGVPYSYMENKGPVADGNGGMTIAISFGQGEFGEAHNLENVRPDAVLSNIAEKASQIAVAFESTMRRPMTIDDAAKMTRASMSGGNAGSVRPSIRRAKAPAAPEFGAGRTVQQTSDGVRPRTVDRITQIDAAKLARGLAFLEPDSEIRRRIITGNLSDLEANVFGAITVDDEGNEVVPKLYTEVDIFLRACGMDAINRKIVLENLAAGIGEPLDSAVLDDTDKGQTDGTDEEEVEQPDGSDEEEEEQTDEGRLEAFQDQKKADSAVKNKDLISLSSILMYVFPSELRNHTALFSRYAWELSKMASVIEAFSGLEADEKSSVLKNPPVEVPIGLANVLPDDGKKGSLEAIRILGRALNTMRSDRKDSPEDLVASSFDWGDDKATDVLLRNATDALVDVGRPDLALITNMLRGIGRGKKGSIKRAKALSDIASMAPLDAEWTKVDFEDGVANISSARAGTGETGAEPVLRAVLGGTIWSPLFNEGIAKGLKTLKGNLVQRISDEEALENLVVPYVDAAGNLTIPKGSDENIAAIAEWTLNDLSSASYIPLSLHESVVDFANELAWHLKDVSKKITKLLGARNELSTILEAKGIEGAVVRALEYEINRAIKSQSSNKPMSPATLYRNLRTAAFYLYEQTFDSYQFTPNSKFGFHHMCPLIETLVEAPITAFARVTASANATETVRDAFEKELREDSDNLKQELREDLLKSMSNLPKAEFEKKLDEEFEKELSKALDEAISGKKDWDNAMTTAMGELTQEKLDDAIAVNEELVHSMARTNVKSTVRNGTGLLSRDEIFQETGVDPRNPKSTLSRLCRWYADVMPRRTARVSIVTPDQTSDSGRVTQTPSTAPLAEYRLAYNLFSKIPYDKETSWYDQYVSNGRQFDDGTFATVVTAGVEIGERLSDGSNVARYVFESNVGRFVEDRDMRNIRFQLYHGEKPTVYSQQLPGKMCEAIWKDIIAGKDYTQNRITKANTEAIAKLPDSLEKIEKPEDRRLAYDMLFSVVAYHAGCAVIDPKRTQVLMAQGVMYSGHRDGRYVVNDSGELVYENFNSEDAKVKPATHMIFSVSGDYGTENMGMYLVNGCLVELQRATATNPEAVSFKNHLNKLADVFLTKGQGHDAGLGIYEDEDIPSSGVLRAAQAEMRRILEGILGLKNGILDLPTETQKADAEYMAERNKAVEAAETFRLHSTLIHSDLETQKVGLFASRNGVKKDADGVFEIGGVKMRVKDGILSAQTGDNGTWKKISGVPVLDVKDKAENPVPLTIALAAYCAATGKESMTEEEVSSLNAEWVGPNGTTVSTLADSGLLVNGDKISMAKGVSGEYLVHFVTRGIIGQVMANNDASSTAGYHSPAPTNYHRDVEANQGLRDHSGEITASQIFSVARSVPSCLIRTDPDLVDAFLGSDEDFAYRNAQHPYDDTVREQRDRKVNAMRAKAMRVYPKATHAVLVGTGIKADVDRATHKVIRYSYAAGVTEYDKDAMRDSRILTTRVAEAYGVDRTIPSGLLNVTNDDSFRYGWHLNEDAFDEQMQNIEALKSSITGLRAKELEYQSVLDQAHGENAQDTYIAAKLAALIWAAHTGSAEQKASVMNILGAIFTDYTGKKLNEHLTAEQLNAISFYDLFMNQDGAREGCDFDFTALEFGKNRKWSREENSTQTIYLGGSIFSADRRPSGNLEASSGVCRAQAPITFNPKTGVPGKTAMYALAPALLATQGADTDGDSATVMRFSERGVRESERELIRNLFAYLDKTRSEREETTRSGKMTDVESAKFIKIIKDNPEYEYLLETRIVRGPDGKPFRDQNGIRTRVTLSEEFFRVLGDLLFEIQVNNYRRTPTMEQDVAPGEDARPGTKFADEGETWDIGFAGRDPVGPDAVFDQEVNDNVTKELYKEVTKTELPSGTSYAKAFKQAIDALTKGRMPAFELLLPEPSAFLSGEANDGSDGRAVIVSLQASVEHLGAYSNDNMIASLCPALYAAGRTDGYSALKDFIAHLDGVSNSLFDVVKDLFAPRAGWRYSMLNYLVATLLHDADVEYSRSGGTTRFGNAWFFRKLLSYAIDFHSSERSIPGLLKRTNADNNFLDKDSFGTSGAKAELTYRGLLADALAEGSGTILRWLAENTNLPESYERDVVKEGVNEYGEPTMVTTKERVTTFLDEAEYRLLSSDSGELVGETLGWLKGLLGFAERDDEFGNLASKLKNAPEHVQNYINGFGEEDKSKVISDLATKMLDLFKCGNAATGVAVASHALFEDANFAGALDRAEYAAVSLNQLSALRNVEAGLSPEPAFRMGSSRAMSKYKKTGADLDPEKGTYKHVSEDNSDYLTQMFVTQDILAGIVHEQFDQGILSDSIAESSTTLSNALSGETPSLDSFKDWCRRYSVTVPSVTDVGEFKRYFSALLLSYRTAPGTVNTNRKRLGRMTSTLVDGLGVMDKAVGREVGELSNEYKVSAATARMEALLKSAWNILTKAPPTDKENHKFYSILGGSIIDMVKHGGITGSESSTGRTVTDAEFLTALRVDEKTGAIGLISKLSVEHADRLRQAFDAFMNNTEVVRYATRKKLKSDEEQPYANISIKYEVVTGVGSKKLVESNMTYADLAWLIQLKMCAHQAFSSVTENDTRVDLSCIFTDEKLNEQERYGVSLEHTLLGRALCCTGGGSRETYDLMRVPKFTERGFINSLGEKLSSALSNVGVLEGESNVFKGIKRGVLDVPSQGVTAIAEAKAEKTPPWKLLLEAALKGGEVAREYGRLKAREDSERQSREARGFTNDAQRLENQIVTSFNVIGSDGGYDILNELNYAPVGEDGEALFPFVGDDGEEYDTLEGAINSYSTQAVNAINKKAPANESMEAQLIRIVKARRDDENWSFQALTKKVISDTAEQYGDSVYKWATEALEAGGTTTIDPVTYKPVREALNDIKKERKAAEKARKDNETLRPSVSVAMTESALVKRMKRSEFAKFLQESSPEVQKRMITNPLENIKFAMETAFGKSSGKGNVGVKVERVKQTIDGVSIPTSLIRITRYYKVKENGSVEIKSAITYIAYGEMLDMHPDTDAYLEGMARSIADTPEAQAVVLSMLRGMSEAQTMAVAKAYGMFVPGESNTGLTTNALLALTGLVRLDGRADYHTLFHEYFHQMLAFYKRTGICTTKDLEELTNRYSIDGKFSEEAAADAFAEYVVGIAENGPSGKLLASGLSDDDKDKLFDKFLTTAQALLAGATTMDENGAPAFMKMIVTGDFSSRAVIKAATIEKAQRVTAEKTILGEDTNVQLELNWQPASEGVARSEANIVGAISDLEVGEGSVEKVIEAVNEFLGDSVDASKHPKFEATTKPFAIEPSPSTPVEEVEEVVSETAAKPADPIPAYVAMADFMRNALGKIGDLSPEEKDIVDDLKRRGTENYDGASDCLMLARTLLRSVSAVYGISVQKAQNADTLFELAVRLAHKLLDEGPTAPGVTKKFDESLTSHRLLAIKVLNRFPTEKWFNAVDRTVENAIRQLEDIQEALMKAGIETSANVLGRSIGDFSRAARMVVCGYPLSEATGVRSLRYFFKRTFPFLDFYVRTSNTGRLGDVSFTDKENARLPGFEIYSGSTAESAMLYAVHAFGMACAYSRLLKENNVDKPTAGAEPVLPANPVVPPPPGVLEPDFSPQMILQSQASWLASDMMKNFFGVNLREIMTDTSLRAAIEKPNAMMNSLNFYFGADVAPGDRARKVSVVDSKLGIKDGVIEANKSNRHKVYSYAGVRGYALGIITRDAVKLGDAFDLDDVSLVNFALQAAGYLANGEDAYITGIDISGDPPERLKALFNKPTIDELVSTTLSPASVIDRVHGKRKGEAIGEERATNLDQTLYKLITALPPAVAGLSEFGRDGKVDTNGLYYRIVSTYYRALLSHYAFKKRGEFIPVDRLAAMYLSETGHSIMVESGPRTGNAYITIPIKDISKVWDESTTVKKLVKAGRKKTLLSLDRAANQITVAADAVNKAAMRSRFVRDSLGGIVTGQNLAGLWFDSGSGGHALALRRFQNAQDLFNIPVSDDETLMRRARAFGLTIASDTRRTRLRNVASRVSGKTGSMSIRGLEGAFDQDGDGNLVNVPYNRMQHLMQLLGLGARPGPEETKKFVEGVAEGLYAKGSTKNPSYVDLNIDMTVYELDRAIYELECIELHKAAIGDGDSILTKPESEGGYGFTNQDIVDFNELLKREGAQLMFDKEADRRVNNLVSTVKASSMLRSFGELPSSKTGPERVMAMADSLVTSERFRGCLAQMLTSVGSNGLPNYVVSPGAAAEAFAPDQYWGALARFVMAKLQVHLGNRISYDDTLSGVENMRRVAEMVKNNSAREDANRPKPTTRIPWHLVPPKDVNSGNLFSFILALDDNAQDGEDVLNKAVGGEAEGYIKQLFGSISAPTVWRGWASIDRIMGLSKALSVGMSAFFAFATRFESPVAACGFINTFMGFGSRRSEAMRKFAASLRKTEAGSKVADFFNFEENMVYLQDFRDVITSDDPYVAQMRELMDLLGMPLSDSIRNPMSDTGGQIDAEIKRISSILIANGHEKIAKEVRGMLNAALHNPGEYAFSNVLNCVKMAVVAQTMQRLRRECEQASRPFDPIRELRRFSSYINAEVGGIQPERYAWLTPGMQQVLRLSMFSYQWTMGAWTAGMGEIASDLIFGGHHTTKDLRRFAFIRWLRMLGIVKVGVPVFLHTVIKALATAIQASGILGDPDDDDDKDVLGIEDMPWLCFDNESKIGALSFDITPILRLCGRLRRGVEDSVPDWRDGVAPALPWISSVVGGVAGAALTRSVGGGLIGSAVGGAVGNLIPDYTGVGHGRNTSGKRRYYMHFGKQSDEFWRWFTDPWSQATNKLSIPTQKVVEAFFGSTNGSNFGKNFADKPLLDRFLTTSYDPQESAIANLFTAFLPFSAASMASNPDAGVLGMFAPVQMGESMTGLQKRIAARLEKFARDDRPGDVWASSRNKKELRLLASDIIQEARINGFNYEEVLNSGLGTASKNLYNALYAELPKKKNDQMDGRKVAEILRAMRRLNVKKQSVDASLRKKYENANVNWRDAKNAAVLNALRAIFRETSKNPWIGEEEMDDLMKRILGEGGVYRDVRSIDVQQDGKGGEAFRNFLATDKVPDTLFGIPVISKDYSDEDLEFFKRNPRAAGFYDLGDEEEPPPDEPPPDGGPSPEHGGIGAGITSSEGGLTVQASNNGGSAYDFYKRNPTLFSHVMKHEKFSATPYRDSRGVAIGFGAHKDINGNPVTMETPAISIEDAKYMLVRDLYERRDRLAKAFSNWQFIPGAAKQALLDVSMGCDNIFSKKKSPSLNKDIDDAGQDPNKLLAAVKKHYYSYRTSDRPEDQAGLESRRIDGGKTFFGEKFSYAGKTWNPNLGFVNKGGKK